jgi:hypothetical protein
MNTIKEQTILNNKLKNIVINNNERNHQTNSSSIIKREFENFQREKPLVKNIAQSTKSSVLFEPSTSVFTNKFKTIDTKKTIVEENNATSNSKLFNNAVKNKLDITFQEKFSPDDQIKNNLKMLKQIEYNGTGDCNNELLTNYSAEATIPKLKFQDQNISL